MALPGAALGIRVPIRHGKGPSRTRTYVYDRIIFSVLYDVLTPVELTLKTGGRGALVRRTQLTFEDVMTATFTGQIERLTAARVLSYHSQIVFDQPARAAHDRRLRAQA